MSFGAGFVTGFANTLADGMLERQKEARDYFNKQVDYARTTGLSNRNKTKQVVDANLLVAKQLEASGVPRDLIMAQINSDPQGLESFAKQAEAIRADAETGRGTTLSSEEWKAIFKVAGDFKAPDEDLATFISRTYDPISHAVSDESFSEDPQGTLISSLLGFNQMDRARAGLAKTEIAEGLTAEQLIRYGDVAPQRQGGSATIVTDYTQIPKKPKKEEGGLGIPQVLPITNAIDEDVPLRVGRAEAELGRALKPEELDLLKEQILEDYVKLYDGDIPAERLLPMIERAFTKRDLYKEGNPLGGSESAPTGPLAPEAGVASPELEAAPVVAPTASADPITPETDPHLLTLNLAGGEVLIWMKDNGDGTSDYQDARSGVTRPYPNSVIRESF